MICKNCAPYTDCLSEINNTQEHNPEDIDIVMPMYNLIEYSNSYLKTSGSSWEYYRDEPDLNKAGGIIKFPVDDNNSVLFKFKEEITSQTGDDSTRDVEVMVPLIYLNEFWRNPEMTLINCEINLIQTWSANCVMFSGNVAS